MKLHTRITVTLFFLQVPGILVGFYRGYRVAALAGIAVMAGLYSVLPPAHPKEQL